MSPEPEFSRPVRIDALGPEPRRIALAADEAERDAVARRFGLVSLARLEAQAAVSRAGEVVTAAGTLRAEATQACVATGEPVEATVEEDFRIEFRPPPVAGEEEIELVETELDVHFYEGASIDLGEAVAQTLPLALDPYPRGAGADKTLKAAGVKEESEAAAGSSPFAALSALKDKLGR